MKIACISDTHGDLPNPDLFDGYDLLIHAGDIGPDRKVLEWIRSAYSMWLRELPCPILSTFGNHDFQQYWNDPHVEHIVQRAMPNPHWGPYEHEGIKMFFSPYVTNLPSWAWNKYEDELDKLYNMIPSDVQILVSHAPPAGGKYGIMMNNEDVGTKSLQRWMTKNPQLPYLICGHIHEGYGKYLVGSTHVLNCAWMDEQYEPQNRFQSFTI